MTSTPKPEQIFPQGRSELKNLLHSHIPERNREETLAKAAQLKLKRNRDASQAMKDHEEARAKALALTIKLRAERLARESAGEGIAKKKKKT